MGDHHSIRKQKKTGSIKNKRAIVCRCEEITEEEIRNAIRTGYHSLEEIKRVLRPGMGHCGGKGCLQIIANLIQEETHISVAKQKFPKSRPPIKPIPIGILGSYRR